ncbi:unnamed protein product [Nesidiocoris tenuis]|uniref:Uncharacterized protein n=1 Tax=Nesidiocoris tenuis TaxID=355587 RepID=A0A6H5G742_9HEMI|nr:unnamed protein product [Nesidiocoris tenuis]
MSGLATMKDDETRMKEDESSCSMYGDEGDDDDDFDDTPRSKRAGKKVDEDYEPPSSATIKKAQGRSSSRTIQLGALIRCVACEFKYHRSCHKPIILARNVNKWKCSSCGPAKFIRLSRGSTCWISSLSTLCWGAAGHARDNFGCQCQGLERRSTLHLSAYRFFISSRRIRASAPNARTSSRIRSTNCSASSAIICITPSAAGPVTLPTFSAWGRASKNGAATIAWCASRSNLIRLRRRKKCSIWTVRRRTPGGSIACGKSSSASASRRWGRYRTRPSPITGPGTPPKCASTSTNISPINASGTCSWKIRWISAPPLPRGVRKKCREASSANLCSTTPNTEDWPTEPSFKISSSHSFRSGADKLDK